MGIQLSVIPSFPHLIIVFIVCFVACGLEPKIQLFPGAVVPLNLFLTPRGSATTTKVKWSQVGNLSNRYAFMPEVVWIIMSSSPAGVLFCQIVNTATCHTPVVRSWLWCDASLPGYFLDSQYLGENPCWSFHRCGHFPGSWLVRELSFLNWHYQKRIFCESQGLGTYCDRWVALSWKIEACLQGGGEGLLFPGPEPGSEQLFSSFLPQVGKLAYSNNKSYVCQACETLQWEVIMKNWRNKE